MKHKRRILVTVALGSLALVLLPLATAAVSNPDFLAIFGVSIDGLVKLTKLAYCVAGWTGVC